MTVAVVAYKIRVAAVVLDKAVLPRRGVVGELTVLELEVYLTCFALVYAQCCFV